MSTAGRAGIEELRRRLERTAGANAPVAQTYKHDATEVDPVEDLLELHQSRER